MYLPIGSIIAWHKSLTGTPALPPGWVECNGGTLDNPTSPYHGQTIPNLNGDGRFLRGAANSGALQDDAEQGHRHILENIAHSAGLSQNAVGDGGSTGTGLRGTGGFSHDGAARMVTDGANGTPRIASETRPKNMSVVWIMRVSDTRRESRLLNPEVEDVHINTTTGAGGSVGGTKGTTAGGTGKPMAEGVVYDGKVPITCVRVGATTTAGGVRGLQEADEFEIVLSYPMLTQRLGKPFDPATCVFYLWDHTTEAWYAPASTKMVTGSKLAGGAASATQYSAVLGIKQSAAGEYVVIGAVQP